MPSLRPLSPVEPANSQRRLTARLVSYSAAASAALAASAPIEAKVVYVPVDNKTVTNGFTLAIGGESVLTFNFPRGIYSYYITVLAPHGVISATDRLAGVAVKLNSGAEIGPSENFGRGIRRMDKIIVTQSGFPFSYGPWYVNGASTTGYLGFRFKINGSRHYGWARLTFTGSGNPTVTLSGYAFETLPETVITAGQENKAEAVQDPDAIRGNSSLGMLAFGSRALSLWRGN